MHKYAGMQEPSLSLTRAARREALCHEPPQTYKLCSDVAVFDGDETQNWLITSSTTTYYPCCGFWVMGQITVVEKTGRRGLPYFILYSVYKLLEPAKLLI